MFYQAKNRQKNKQGFTMIEALVAITILLIAVIGPLSLLATALRDSLYLRNEITANYLAQESLEVVTFFNATGNLLQGTYCVDGTKDSLSDSLILANKPLEDCVVKLNESGYYGHSGGTETIFRRFVTVAETVNELVADEGGRELKITSTVSWQNSGLLPDREIAYVTYLYTDN